ncbi:MAG: tRNA (adenosine(37)-N6)-threonylcarbamoyltransferase complex dimerization subunit type 1 TsaB [Steroidobacteraceae bacterium]
MKLLALDTATELCSAALWLDGASLTREDSRPRAAGELILGMIQSLLAEAGLTLAGLDAIGFGRGPGGFTGVRLATTVAQGLGFAAGLPLLPISDLRALAQQAGSQPDAARCVLVCQDARMGQVYWGCFETAGTRPRIALPVTAPGAMEEAVADPAAVRLPEPWEASAVCGAGSGFEAYPYLGSRPDLPLSPIWGGMRPRALEIACLAAFDGLSVAVAPELAQPVYLRDEVTARRS